MQIKKLPAESRDAEKAGDQAIVDYIAAVANRDQRALAALYEATIGRVYGVALRILRSRQAAEEVAEDVYVQVWATAARFDAARGRPLGWLLTICRSRALDYLRREEPATPYREPDAFIRAEDCAEGDPQNLLLSCERNQQLHRVMHDLTALERQLVSMAFFRGLTHQEIAERTGMPLGTVKSDIRRALMRLREALEIGQTAS